MAVIPCWPVMLSQSGPHRTHRIREAGIPRRRRRRRVRRGFNIRPLEQWAINNLSEMVLIIRPRLGVLTGRNLAQEPISPSYTPAGSLLVTWLPPFSSGTPP